MIRKRTSYLINMLVVLSLIKAYLVGFLQIFGCFLIVSTYFALIWRWTLNIQMREVFQDTLIANDGKSYILGVLPEDQYRKWQSLKRCYHYPNVEIKQLSVKIDIFQQPNGQNITQTQPQMRLQEFIISDLQMNTIQADDISQNLSHIEDHEMMQELTGKIAQLEMQLLPVQQEKRKLELKMEALQSKYDAKKQSVKQKKAQYKKCEEKIHTLNQKESTLEQQIKTAEDEIKQTETDLAEQGQLYERIHQQRLETKDQYERYMFELAPIKKYWDHYQTVFQQLQEIWKNLPEDNKKDLEQR